MKTANSGSKVRKENGMYVYVNVIGGLFFQLGSLNSLKYSLKSMAIMTGTHTNIEDTHLSRQRIKCLIT